MRVKYEIFNEHKRTVDTGWKIDNNIVINVQSSGVHVAEINKFLNYFRTGTEYLKPHSNSMGEFAALLVLSGIQINMHLPHSWMEYYFAFMSVTVFKLY